MRFDTVLFDLDGTLLPMDLNVFLQRYFDLLLGKLTRAGVPDDKKAMDALWRATGDMIQNDGSALNETVFRNRFRQYLGKDARLAESVFDGFYQNEFQQAKDVCGFAPEAAPLVRRLRAAGVRTILATAPVYPRAATVSRLRWAGLEPEDFAYMTTFENASYGKPNPNYYREILDTCGLDAASCLMVGNDTGEDGAAEAVGISLFYLTEFLINRKNIDVTQYPHGGWAELNHYLFPEESL